MLLYLHTLSSLVQEFLSISYVCLLKLSHLMVVVAVHYILQNRNTNISITNNAVVLTTPWLLLCYSDKCVTSTMAGDQLH
jgi:hypothetical protein